METYTRTEPSRRSTPADLQLLHDAAARMFALRRVLRPLIQQAKARAAPALPPHASEAQIHVLGVLAEADSLAAGELAERCHVADPTMSKMLTHLEQQGLIVRSKDPTNRREVRVRLTDVGQRTLETSRNALVMGLERVLSPLTPAQLRDLITTFNHLEGLVAPEEHATTRKSRTYKEC